MNKFRARKFGSISKARHNVQATDLYVGKNVSQQAPPVIPVAS